MCDGPSKHTEVISASSPAFQVTKRVPARNTNAIATGRAGACHASSSAIEFEETVLCECHSGNCLDGTPDGNKKPHDDVWSCGMWIHGGVSHSRQQRTSKDTFRSSWCLERRESGSLPCGIVFHWETQGTAEPTTPRRVTSCIVVSMTLRRRYSRQLAQDPGQFDWEGRVRCRLA